jgi:hypothetical protein
MTSYARKWAAGPDGPDLPILLLLPSRVYAPWCGIFIGEIRWGRRADQAHQAQLTQIHFPNMPLPAIWVERREGVVLGKAHTHPAASCRPSCWVEPARLSRADRSTPIQV